MLELDGHGRRGAEGAGGGRGHVDQGLNLTMTVRRERVVVVGMWTRD